MALASSECGFLCRIWGERSRDDDSDARQMVRFSPYVSSFLLRPLLVVAVGFSSHAVGSRMDMGMMILMPIGWLVSLLMLVRSGWDSCQL
jgi:hypothetical protein